MKSVKFFTENPEYFDIAKSYAEAGDLTTLKKYIMEALRLTPPGPMLIRYAEKDYVISKGTVRETLIPKGTSVLLGIYSAMKDPEVIPDPEKIVLGRPDNSYFLFGYGHHKCAGDQLATEELSILMSALLQKPNLKYINRDKNSVFPEERYIQYDKK